MVSRFEIFQCIPAYKPYVASRLINRIKKPDCRILLDIEDSIMDVEAPECTSILKQEARKAARIITELCPGLKPDLRINSPGSPEFAADIEVLRDLSERLNSVFIPKVESEEDMEKIISGRMKKHIEYIFFGNYDYHLDADIFPLIEQDSGAYWTFIKPLIGQIENENLHFGNSPYADIDDSQSLQTIIYRLSGICKRSFALISLHQKQTEMYNELKSGNLPGKVNVKKVRPAPDPRKILDAFRENRQKNRSFSLNRGSLSIITPQEYLLANRRTGNENH